MIKEIRLRMSATLDEALKLAIMLYHNERDENIMDSRDLKDNRHMCTIHAQIQNRMSNNPRSRNRNYDQNVLRGFGHGAGFRPRDNYPKGNFGNNGLKGRGLPHVHAEKSTQPSIQCYKCGTYGHMQRDCRKWSEGRPKQNTHVTGSAKTNPVVRTENRSRRVL